MHQGAANVDATLHTSGVRAYLVLAAVGQRQLLQHFSRANRRRLRRESRELAPESQVLFGGQFFVERDFLGDNAHALLRSRRVLGKVDAVHEDRALVGSEQATDHFDRGGFACSVGAKQSVDFARVDLQRDVRDRSQITEGFR